MKIRLTASFLALAIAALAGCDRAEAPATQADPGDPDILALVNTVPITRSDVFSYAGLTATMGAAGTADVLEELINLELLRQQAQTLGIDQEDAVQKILRNVETNLLASQVIERQVAGIQLTETEIEAEYQKQIAALGQTEYRARHILVDHAEEAAALVVQLAEGADFGALAREHSLDGAASRGGDLGWFVPAQMVPAFSSAVAALQPGEFTREPVESEFGWHVILLEDTRDAEPPPLQDVRAQIEEILQAHALQRYVESLRAAARIEFPERPAQ